MLQPISEQPITNQKPLELDNVIKKEIKEAMLLLKKTENTQNFAYKLPYAAEYIEKKRNKRINNKNSFQSTWKWKSIWTINFINKQK